ncbi:MAG: hypothetical protein B5M51_09085 [Anaerolinea sp. 4484_236]|nr:MAG: hypothetical protein B5M51_09085 [Anaerolinea sp. 4484_236]RLD09260.1 MAG: hypothetical protein DRI56_04565 [Chloroflexota bacterium]
MTLCSDTSQGEHLTIPRKKAIPDEVREEVERIVSKFNRKMFRNSGIAYSTQYKGKYLYLKRNEHGKPGPICRLTYTGEMDAWEFAIYKYSANGYDPDEWFFPGVNKVDGTIKGAMLAGLEAYPV